MTKQDVIDFFNSMSDEELQEKWKKYEHWQASADQSKLNLADVSKCNCKELVKCDNCGCMVKMISTGEMCPNCYC
jgi:membrane protease subunit (stomatin/prohibitin family)